jgi:tetratricopeptide (TPR) repeat protein
VKAALGQHFTAIRDFDKAIELNPDLDVSYYNRGKANGQFRHNFIDAIKDFNKAIELNPNNVQAYISRGIMKAALGQHFAAIRDFDKVIELTLPLIWI